MSDKKFLGLYCGKPVYEGDENERDFLLSVENGKYKKRMHEEAQKILDSVELNKEPLMQEKHLVFLVVMVICSLLALL